MRQTAIASTSQLAEARIAIPVGMLLDVLVPQDRQSDVLALKLAVNAFGCAGMSLTSTPTPIVSRLLLRDIRLPTETTHLLATRFGAVTPLTCSRTGAEKRSRSATGHFEPFPPPRLNGRCPFSLPTSAGASGNRKDAPKAGTPVLRALLQLADRYFANAFSPTELSGGEDFGD